MKTSSPSSTPVVKKEKPRKSSRDKKKQLTLTNQWLDENYCVCDGVCIPRCILYSHYLDFCQNHSLLPACAATFGKIIRQKFPNITTRRLGTRGHSKYHYYGICIKETRQYYQALYSGGGLTRFSGSKFLNEGGFTRKYCLSSKIGLPLPDFPSCYNLNLPSHLNPAKIVQPAENQVFEYHLQCTLSLRERTILRADVDTLLMMYRSHCQCILDTTVSSHFAEIPTYLMHFWQGIPDHLLPLLEDELVINLIVYCDTILYSTLTDVLIPATMQEVSQQLLLDIQKLVGSWESWMTHSLRGLPVSLFTHKTSVAQNFLQTLRRQSTFLHLAQMVRPILYDCRMVNQMNADISAVPAKSCNDDRSGKRAPDSQLEVELLTQLKDVLQKQATVEAFTEWLDVTLTQKVVKPCGNNQKLFKKKAHMFLVLWSKFGAELIRELTEQNATSLESINLLRLLLDEYIMVAIESQIQEQTTQDLLSEIRQFAVSLPITDINDGDQPGASEVGQYVAQIYSEGSAIPCTDETIPRQNSFYQGACFYGSSYQEWMAPSAYQWSPAMGTCAGNQAVIASTNIPHMTGYDVTRFDCPPYYSHISCSTDSAIRDGHGQGISDRLNIAQEAAQHLPSIGHVLY